MVTQSACLTMGLAWHPCALQTHIGRIIYACSTAYAHTSSSGSPTDTKRRSLLYAACLWSVCTAEYLPLLHSTFAPRHSARRSRLADPTSTTHFTIPLQHPCNHPSPITPCPRTRLLAFHAYPHPHGPLSPQRPPAAPPPAPPTQRTPLIAPNASRSPCVTTTSP